MTDEWIDEVLNSLTNEVEWSVQVPGSVKINREREAEVIKQAKATILAKQAEAVEAARKEELNWCLKRPHGGQAGFSEITDRLSQLTNNTEKE